MVLNTGSLAAGQSAAAVNALGVGFSTDKVGDGLAIFGGIGRLTVATDTCIGEGFGVATVAECVGGGSRDLETEEWARDLLLLTPLISGGEGDGVWVDGLGISQADDRGEDEESVGEHDV